MKTPFGRLILETDPNQEEIIRETYANSLIITVGDATTEKLLKMGLIPFLQIIDGQEKRIKRNVPESELIKTYLDCQNSPGEISQKSISIIRDAFDSKPPIRITVNGEEDLLVIPVCLHAPENCVVMYGQPNEGLVIVHINHEIKEKVQKIVNSMN
ncbi:GTP-dependent dephospho-CoA kinase family protein [Candidatus Nitrosopelagicus sp.]|nr:GTP-dependent dephospho-CoA kinase family protein [Candidatus Nitrosopelagicus sp.]